MERERTTTEVLRRHTAVTAKPQCVTVSGVSVNIGVVAVPQVVNGQTQIVVKDIQTGAIPLPDAIKSQINAQIGSALDPSKLGLPIDVSQIQIVNGQLVIKGTAQP